MWPKGMASLRRARERMCLFTTTPFKPMASDLSERESLLNSMLVIFFLFCFLFFVDFFFDFLWIFSIFRRFHFFSFLFLSFFFALSFFEDFSIIPSFLFFSFFFSFFLDFKFSLTLHCRSPNAMVECRLWMWLVPMEPKWWEPPGTLPLVATKNKRRERERKREFGESTWES